MKHTSYTRLRVFISVFALFEAVFSYLILVPETKKSEDVIFNASVYKLGSDRHYKINTHRSANFVHHIIHVNSIDGRVSLKKRLKCDGVHYPNLFTFYVDSTSDRVTDIDFYSLPIRILVTGQDCSRKSADTFYQDFDDATDLSGQHSIDKRDLSNSNENLDWRVSEEDVTYSSHLNRKFLQGYGTHSSSKYKNRLKRSQTNVPFDMAIDVKLSEAKQWISETFASFAIPTGNTKWQQICIRKSQFINSLSAFLPQSISKNCKVQFLDVSDSRFVIENSQSDLVASRDVCIQEPLWKVTVLFTFNCDSENLVDSDHRLKIVYHHQEFNDTDIARRVRRELRNQSPFFEQPLYVASVAEEQPPGVLVTTVRARDPEKSPVTYSMSSLLDSRSAGMFGVDAQSGAVTTLARLDRERLDVHYFRLVARDDTFPPRSGTTTLQINVLDCNDHAPIFELQQYEASVREGASPDTVIITLKATDQDIGKNAEVEYLIDSVQADNTPTIEDIADNESSVDSETNGTHETYVEMQEVFRIDARTGALLTRSMLDREKVVRYIVTVKATDQAMPITDRLSSSAMVYINILDDNDNYPQFTERTYTVLVDEDINISDNPIIARIKATDADTGANAAIRYAIIGGNTQMQFSIDSLSGDVSLVKPLDYELVRSYRLVIRAQDGGSPSRSNTTLLLVNVRDVNDNAPRFYTSLFQESVSENVAIGYSIVRVQAYDADEGVNAELTYKFNDKDVITHDKFPLNIDPRTGWIYTVKQLDREEFAKYQLQVVATDGGIPPHSATASVAIVVQDVNDNDPVFSPNQYEATVAEDEPPGTPVVTVTATDADEDNRLHYEISAGNTRGRFAISSQNGRGLITVAQPLDYKQERRYILTISATDSGGRLDSALVHINVSDANNYAPVFENAPYSALVFEDAPIGTTVLVVAASDNDVGINAQISYSLGVELSNDAVNTENEFIINPQTGAILTNKLLDREAMSEYLLTVTARDGGTPSLSDTTDVEISVVDVNDNKPVFKQQLYSATVTEDALVGTSVIQISATDADVGLNGKIHYDLSAKDREDASFIVDKSSGVIRTNKALDRESVASYDIRALAVDGGTPAMSAMVVVHLRIEDVNDSPPVFESDRLTLYIAENSPIGTTVGEIHANDPDEGINAIVHYSIKGGDDSNSFSLETRQGLDSAYLVTMVDLDYESPRKKYELVIRAASPPLWSDVHIDILVTDGNDNAPVLKDFQVIFNNYQDCFPVGTFGRVPAFDADVGDKLNYRILSGNNANLVLLNDTTGGMTLSPQLNTNVPKLATMEISVSDGVNEAKAVMQLSVRLITEEMLFNSITVRLNDMTAESFLSPLLLFFLDGLAAIIPCPKENIYMFSMQDDTQIGTSILNVSFSARRPDAEVTSLGDVTQYYTPTYLRERIYLNRATLARLATVQVLPFDDNVCVHEPCLNYEHCLTVLKFGNASTFIHSDVVLFRPIYPVATFACQCPNGFTGFKDHYMCDTEVDLCYSSPCTNGGSCMRREGGFSCVCSPGFTGVNCETILEKAQCEDNVICRGGAQCVPSREGGVLCQGCSFSANYTTPLCELRARSFSRMSFLTFPSLKQRHRLHIKLRFATINNNGLLLYNGRYNERHDFIVLEVIGTGAGSKSRSGIRFMFSLGGSVSEVTVGGDVADGNWHTIELEYLDRKATLSLDDCDKAISLVSTGIDLGEKWACANETYKDLPDRCNIATETCHRFFDLTGPMQIGGLPSIPTSFQVKTKDFRGCIADLYIDHKFVDLNNYVADNGTVAGCPEKLSHCDSKPCYNGATCREVWDTYHCDCAEGHTGKDCGESTSLPWRFNGDGILSFNPLLRPIQLPWLNALSVRTRQHDTFLMSIQIGQNSSAVISLKSGMLQYTYNSEYMFVPGSIISDGEWHRIEMKWLGTDIAVNIDYGSKNTLLPMLANKIQGLYIGKILIGGPDSTSSMLAADYGYFEGCIQDVRVGNMQSLLNRPTVRENVRDGCQSRADCLLSACATNGMCIAQWDTTDCSCGPGQVGLDCRAACSLQPCGTHGLCVDDNVEPRGYACKCLNNTQLIDNQCVEQKTTPCPSGWWGTRGCGPCNCPIEQGYHPDCNKTTGECFCKENHYQPPGSTKCLACQCYTVGSITSSCDINTGQCPCRTGVIGRACNTCPNPYAEVTPDGCQVVYDGCPRSFSHGVWWSRTSFGFIAVSHCPSGTSGKASRACDKMQNIPWQEPELFNCTSSTFYQLRTQLNQIEKEEIQLNTFVAVKIAEDLRKACENTSDMYGADILISESILLLLLNHELLQKGLNLTHSQDKDYIKNIVKSANYILHQRYKPIWYKINDLTGHSAEYLVSYLDKYISILAESQHDTYTSPFEIVTSQTVLGMDIITVESIYGFEPAQLAKNNLMSESSASEQVILPDTSLFVHSAIQGGAYFNTGKMSKNSKAPTGLTVSFPKYNNYIANKDKFDKYTRILVSMETLGIKPYNPQDTTYKWSSSESKAIVSYIQYSKAGAASLMPLKCDESVSQRWGVDISLGSPIIQVSVFVPEYIWLKELNEISESGISSNESQDGFEGTFYSNSLERSKDVNSIFGQSDDDIWTDDKRSRQGDTLDKHGHGPIIIEPSLKRTEGDFVNTIHFNNEASHTVEKKLDNFNMDDGPKVMAWTNSAMNHSNSQRNQKILYKSLSNLTLKRPIRLQMWLDIDRELFSMRTNPQCVFWSTKRGDGEWSRIGCHTEIDYDWRPDSTEPLLINCTCNHLSTFAVIIDEIDIEFVPEASLLEAVTSYSAFCISLPILVVVLTALCLMRGGVATVSNSIHKHLVISVFMAELIYFVALKGRTQLVQNEFACKLIAMSLHYWWLAALAWCACDAWQLRRLLREVRDVNHGPLAAHYAVGYAAPAVALALAAGAHQHQYGNALFCWVSCHEAVVWWVVGPAGALSLAAILCLIAAARAAFTLRDHVCGFGNLRVLLGVSMVCMPLLACAWASALLLASENNVERRSALTAALSASVLAHAVSAALGYCILNVRVRDNLMRTLLCCLGKKVPIVDTSVVINSSLQNISQGNRSALMYHSGGAEGENRSRTLRHVGISASSTTSRSTTKTSSSPYSRSDRQVRHTSTSTSNYNSASDMPSYLRGFDSSLQPSRDEALRLKWRVQKDEPVEAGTESESEGSGARSLDLASSHSSDDEDTSNRRTSTNTSQIARNEHHSYLPNITEGASLNSVLSLSQVKDISAPRPRWPPHLDSTYNGNDKTKECGRWSQETGSDNEIINHALTIKTPSPNPLPNPDLTSDTLYQISKHRGIKSAILENIHEAYVANVDLSSQSTVDNRFNTMDNDYDIKLSIAPLEEDQPCNQYDHNVQMSGQTYALRDDPYGPKSYLPARTSDYLYSPSNFAANDKMYNTHSFKDNDIAAMLRVDFQRKTDNNYVADYADRMSESSDKHHPQEKYLFPYTAEEDHVGVRGMNQSPSPHENNSQYSDVPHPMATPRANIGESNENIPDDNDAETRV